MTDGLFTARPSPSLGALEGQRLSTEAQLRELSADDQERKMIHWTVQASVPEKYQAGDMYYFAADVVGPFAGIYFYNGSAWVFTGIMPTAYGILYSSTPTAFSIGTTGQVVKPWTNSGSSPVDVVQDATNGSLQVDRAGLYMVTAQLTFNNPAPNITYSIVFHRNGFEAPLTRSLVTAKDNNDGVRLAAMIVAPLNAGDALTVVIGASSAQSITVNTKSFFVVEQ